MRALVLADFFALLQFSTAWTEDRALLRSNPSAAPGVGSKAGRRTGRRPTFSPNPCFQHHAINLGGLGAEPPSYTLVFTHRFSGRAKKTPGDSVLLSTRLPAFVELQMRFNLFGERIGFGGVCQINRTLRGLDCLAVFAGFS